MLFLNENDILQIIPNLNDSNDLFSYNGTVELNIEVVLADYDGEYDLGKRDVGGTCVDFSVLKQREIDDVC